MVLITNIVEFKQNIRTCVELRIPRPTLDYSHHVFVGDVDEDGCYIYHYKSKSSLSLISFPPAKITKVRLQYKTYDTCSEILNIFNFHKGDKVEIVDRSDYQTTDSRECIKRAESRCGESKYTASFNNCESYVNWVFSKDNSSKQAQNSLKNYFLTLGLDELSLSKTLTFLHVIVPKLNERIKKMLGKIGICHKLNLEKYWNKFEQMVKGIIDKPTKCFKNSSRTGSKLSEATQWLKNNLWIVDAIVAIVKLFYICNADFLTFEQKAQNMC